MGFIRPGYFAFRHTGHVYSVKPILKKIVDSSFRGVNYVRLGIVGTGLVGGMLGIHLFQQNGWWKDNRTSFHFQEDLRYSRGLDKVGHFYGASVVSFIVAKSIETANVPEEKALLIGSGAGLLFQTFLEVEDGFSTWGFDRVDFATDVGGAVYPILQYYVPFFKNFEMKYSYHPVNFNKPGTLSFPGQKHLISDDYEGQTLWLALKINNLLPRSIEPFWPDWLGIAVGYGVRDIETPYDYPVVFLAPDLDMTKIIPHTTWFLRTLGDALNYIHLPLPAVQISPRTIWYGLYF
jgi:hypothetical protein